jgi:heterotetrameric sarcosine oxidase delta subunit
MSYVLTCPNCGIREVTDFAYGGELNPRPKSAPTLRELGEYNYFRRNIAGVQQEWWLHRSGCGEWFIAERDTRTNEVHWTAPVDEVFGAAATETAGAAAGGAAGGGVAGPGSGGGVGGGGQGGLPGGSP